jgi:hypothetical protein
MFVHCSVLMPAMCGRSNAPHMWRKCSSDPSPSARRVPGPAADRMGRSLGFAAARLRELPPAAMD